MYLNKNNKIKSETKVVTFPPISDTAIHNEVVQKIFSTNEMVLLLASIGSNEQMIMATGSIDGTISQLGEVTIKELSNFPI